MIISYPGVHTIRNNSKYLCKACLLQTAHLMCNTPAGEGRIHSTSAEKGKVCALRLRVLLRS